MYVKLFQTILTSSIWDEDMSTRIVWITLLALADEDGYAKTTDHSLAMLARVDDVTACNALQVLQDEDPNSGNPDNEGRRIEKVQGGYLVLNYKKYRDMKTKDEQRDENRLRVAAWRAKKKAERNVTVTNVTNVTHSYEYEDEDESVSVLDKGESLRGAFDEIWERYPKKAGKKAAERHFRASVKTEDDVNRITRALDHYRASDRVLRGFIQDGATWFNNWQDWIEPTEAMMRDKTNQQQHQEPKSKW